MTLMDAAFLYSEDGRTHNDVGNVLVFEGPSITREELMQSVADRIALVPRFRQRIKHMPFGVGLPVWIDDTTFDMGRHVRYHPAPAHRDPIGAAVSRVMSVPMDLSIPLWEMHLITGLDNERWVLIVRMHHAMVDGVSTTEILRLLMSPEPEGHPAAVIDTWHPHPEPPDVVLLVRLYEDFLKEMAAAWQSFLSGSANLSLPQLPQTFDPSPLMQPGIPISPMAINGLLEPGRHFGMFTLPLATFKEIRQALGGTVNDLILTACGFGYSSAVEEYLHEPVQGRTMRVMVPVSLRSEASSEGSSDGNEIGAMVVEVPLGDMPAVDRLARIHEQTKTLKSLSKSVPVPDMTQGSSLASPLVLMMGGRAASMAPTFVNTIVTNVPGPQNTLYLQGRRMLRFGACVALWTPLKIAISVLSYDGTVTISAVTDEATFPTVQPLLDAIEAGIEDLREAAKVLLVDRKP